MNRATNFHRDVFRDGAGVSLLLRHPKAGQKVDNCFRLDLELAGQFVNSDLIGFSHALRFESPVLRILFFRIFGFAGFCGGRFTFRRSY